MSNEMTRAAVDNTIARLKAWVRAADSWDSCRHDGADDRLDDLEDLRQHDEAQAAENERLRLHVAHLCALIKRPRREARRTRLDAQRGPTSEAS